MKDITKKCSLLLVFIALLLATGCSSTLTYEAAMNKNRKNISDFARLEDANFLVEAASFNLLEREISELAKEKGYSAALVDLARTNALDHQNMQRELSKLARREKIVLPATMKSEHRTIHDRLKDAGRSDFDKDLVSTLEDINEENLELYEEKASKAHDVDIRSFASRHLDMLRNHSEAISKVDRQLMQTQR